MCVLYDILYSNKYLCFSIFRKIGLATWLLGSRDGITYPLYPLHIAKSFECYSAYFVFLKEKLYHTQSTSFYVKCVDSLSKLADGRLYFLDSLASNSEFLFQRRKKLQMDGLEWLAGVFQGSVHNSILYEFSFIPLSPNISNYNTICSWISLLPQFPIKESNLHEKVMESLSSYQNLWSLQRHLTMTCS